VGGRTGRNSDTVPGMVVIVERPTGKTSVEAEPPHHRWSSFTFVPSGSSICILYIRISYLIVSPVETAQAPIRKKIVEVTLVKVVTMFAFLFFESGESKMAGLQRSATSLERYLRPRMQAAAAGGASFLKYPRHPTLVGGRAIKTYLGHHPVWLPKNPRYPLLEGSRIS